MNQETYHTPALLQPSIDALDIHPGGVYVDVTFGGGGHSGAILAEVGDGRLYSFDQDTDAISRAASDPVFADNNAFTLIHGNFRYLKNFLRYYGVHPGTVNGLLADLGVSFHHFDDEQRGFSFRFPDSALDMRMNPRAIRTAADILNEYPEEKLEEIFRLYGELSQARALARRIAADRREHPLTTVKDLLDIIAPLMNPAKEKKELAQLFQALRIEVNGELNALRAMLNQAVEMLAPGGRLAVITYHSLEDRLVKNFMKTGNFEGKVVKDFYGRSETPLKPLGSKPVVPDDYEIERNPRSRSAKLRVAVKKQPQP